MIVLKCVNIGNQKPDMYAACDTKAIQLKQDWITTTKAGDSQQPRKKEIIPDENKLSIAYFLGKCSELAKSL